LSLDDLINSNFGLAFDKGETVMNTYTLEIPQDILDSARLTLAELKTEMAVALYAQGRLSIGKARELANLSLWEFRTLLGARRISPHYDEHELATDLATLQSLESR
jgi:predicted HTH domain antitoxin